MTGDTQEQQPQARVFISCGQGSKKEKQLGFACRDYFKSQGYKNPYLAEEVQRLESLTENIFHRLRNSEYAVFIDCRRERVSRWWKFWERKFRGSMFVNQEFAIAAFIPIVESRVFHQNGVIREGVVKSLIAKPIQFSNEQEFLTKLKEETKEWRNDWRNELFLKYLEVVHDVLWPQNNTIRDWYHLQVMNWHKDKYARNCVAYVTEIKNIDTGEVVKPDSFELVWAGTGLFEKHILHDRPADVDAFFIVQGENVIRFHHRPSTSSQYGIQPLGKGNYLLTYMIISENFEEVTKTFKLEFGGDYTQIKFGEEVA